MQLPRVFDALQLTSQASGWDLMAWGWDECGSGVLSLGASSVPAVVPAGIGHDSFRAVWSSGVQSSYSQAWTSASAYAGMTISILMALDLDANSAWHVSVYISNSPAGSAYDYFGLKSTSTHMRCFAIRADGTQRYVEFAPLVAAGSAVLRMYTCVLDHNVMTAYLDGVRQADYSTGGTFGAAAWDYSVYLMLDPAPRTVASFYLFPSALSIAAVHALSREMFADTGVAPTPLVATCPSAGASVQFCSIVHVPQCHTRRNRFVPAVKSCKHSTA